MRSGIERGGATVSALSTATTAGQCCSPTPELCDLCELVCAIEPMAAELKAIDVANYMAELMADTNKAAVHQSPLRCTQEMMRSFSRQPLRSTHS